MLALPCLFGESSSKGAKSIFMLYFVIPLNKMYVSLGGLIILSLGESTAVMLWLASPFEISATAQYSLLNPLTALHYEQETWASLITNWVGTCMFKIHKNIVHNMYSLFTCHLSKLWMYIHALHALLLKWTVIMLSDIFCIKWLGLLVI